MVTDEILQLILGKLDSLEAGQSRLEENQSRLEGRQAQLENQNITMQQEQREMRILLEDIPRQIRLIAEQHSDINKRLDRIGDYEETKSRVSTLENIARSHSTDILELKNNAV